MIILKEATIVDLAEGKEFTGDILIAEGIIQKIGSGLVDNQAEVIDCRGKHVFPGFVDMHVHLRQPGQEHKENIETGLKAAAAGGFTAVCAMANTNPPVDNPGVLRSNLERARGKGIDYYQIAAATVGQKGKKIVPVEELQKAGAVAFSDDGFPIQDKGLMTEILSLSKELGFTLIEHCEDCSLAPTDPLSEVRMVERNLNLLAGYGGNLHLAHVSCGDSLRLIKEALGSNLDVTCEVTPHHLVLTQEAVKKYGTLAKVNPPLRRVEDVEALQEALCEKVIHCIATDHAPHTREEKNVSYKRAPVGIMGLETAVGILWDFFFHRGLLKSHELGRLFSQNPARIMGLARPAIKEGNPAVMSVIDAEKEWTVNPETFYSRSQNTPFTGWKLRGAPFLVVHAGNKIMEDGRVL